PGGDYLMLVDASVNSTKLNAILEQQAELTVQLDAAGAATNTVAIDYFNNLAPWAEGRDPQLVYKLMLGGLYGDYLRVLVPPGSRIAQVRDGEGSVGLEELSREQGLTVFGRFFPLPRDTRDRLSFTYTTPPVVERHGGGMTYRLRLQAQPGRPIPLSVRVAPPDGMRIRRLLLDGVPQHDASVPRAGGSLATASSMINGLPGAAAALAAPGRRRSWPRTSPRTSHACSSSGSA